MIKQLNINNIAVIDSASVEFDKGFSILTGETGAGKSIIIDSLNMLKGERASKTIIRKGEEKAKVSALIWADDLACKEIFDEVGIEVEDNEIMLSREITLDGKNNIRVNGEAITLNMLKKIGDILITIHGQHDNTSLLSKKTHIVFLDRFGYDAISPIKSEYSLIHNEYKQVKEKLDSIRENISQNLLRRDMIEFQLKEIEEADLKIGEDEELNERRNVLVNSQEIADNVNKAYGLIYGDEAYESSAYDMLWSGIKNLENASDIDSSLKDIFTSVSDCGYIIEENMRVLKKYINSLSFDSKELDFIEERLALIYNLKRKYGASIEDIKAHYEKIAVELHEIDNSDEILFQLEEKLKELESKREKMSKKLTLEREKSGKRLSEMIMKELCDLDMSKVKLQVKIVPCDFREDGADDVEFLICTNVGEDFKPLTKIASGGELSRIMLAIKSVLSHFETPDTLIFDEVDTGVSGQAAQRLGVKLYDMSKSCQVLCITHLPQIAAMADEHYLIEKNVCDGRTSTSVKKLVNEDRVDELARTLGGATITDITRQNAKELLNQAEEYKKKEI